MEDVGLLLNKAGKTVANDTEKAEVSSVFYASVFNGKHPVPKYPCEIKNEKANNKITSGMKKKKKLSE